MTTPFPQLLPAGQMARYLGVPAGWLKGEAEAGRIPHLKAGKIYLFNPEVVERLLAERAAQGNRT